MKKFYKFKSSTNHIRMPLVDNKVLWVAFFKDLEKIDCMAPLFTMLAYCTFIEDDEHIFVPATPLHHLYYNLGIEMRAADRYPAYEAAEATGFVEKGVSMIISAAADPYNVHHKEFSMIVKQIYHREPRLLDKVSPAIFWLGVKILNHEWDDDGVVA